MTTWLPPRLRPLLGNDLSAVTAERLAGLIGLAEDTDLEFKSLPWESTEGGNKECALDIADKANASGGLIVIGIEEDGAGKAASLVPLDAEGDLGLRVHQVVAERVSPSPLVSHAQVVIGNGVVHLFAIAPTTRSPHAVAVGGHALRFPLRVGVFRRYLTEPELAERYQRRFAGARHHGERLSLAHAEAQQLIPAKRDDGGRWSWLIVSASPEFPGHLSSRRGVAEEWKAWLNLASVQFPSIERKTTLRVSSGFRRLLIDDGLPGSASDVYATGGFLGWAGDGGIVLGQPGGHGAAGAVEGTSLLYDENLVGDLMNAVGMLAIHASRCGAVGDLGIAAEVVSAWPMMLGASRCDFPGPLDGGRVLADSTGRAEHAASIDALHDAGVERVATVRLLALDLFSAFGQPDVEQVTSAGDLAISAFNARRHDALRLWASEGSVPTTP